MSTLSPALRTLAALRGAAHLVGRPTGVAHVYVGPLTPSGRFVPSKAATVCRAATRRLQVLEAGASALGRGRRVCRRCQVLLPPALGVEVPQLVTRDDWVAAYSNLTISDLVLAAAWCRTVEETHQVGYVTSVVHGQQPIRQPAEGSPARALYDLHARILYRRRQLLIAARTPEEVAEMRARQAEQIETHAQILAGRRAQQAIDRAHERRRRGEYLTPRERQLVAS